MKDEYDVIEAISSVQVTIANNPDNKRAATEAYKTYMQAGDFMRPRDQGPMVTINQVVLPPGIEKLMLSRMGAVSDAGAESQDTGTDGETLP